MGGIPLSHQFRSGTLPREGGEECTQGHSLPQAHRPTGPQAFRGPRGPICESEIQPRRAEPQVTAAWENDRCTENIRFFFNPEVERTRIADVARRDKQANS